jgi:hypothetical protein
MVTNSETPLSRRETEIFSVQSSVSVISLLLMSGEFTRKNGHV